MAKISTSHAAVAAALFIIFKLFKFLHSRWAFQHFRKTTTCQPTIDLSGPFPYGLNRINRIRHSRLSGEDILDDILGPEIRQAGTFQMTMVEGSCMITTTEPANVQAMLATQFSDFDTGRMRHNQFWPVLGRSIFSSDGAFWEHPRALLRPQFVRDNINDLDETREATDMLIQAIGSVDESRWTGTVDLKPMIFNFTLDTATSFLFGESVESQKAFVRAKEGGSANDQSGGVPEATSKEFLDAFATASDYTIYRLRLQSLYWLADGLKFRRAARTLHNFASHFVRDALAYTAASKDKPSDENSNKTLLYALATQTRDHEELRAQATAVLFAGRDTTAALICWCILRLAQHPDIYDQLRRIILSTFPAGQPIAFAQLKSCRYLQHYINEVLRLHPAIPFNNRVANKHTTLPRGGGPDQKAPIAVRKGQSVAFSLYHMHRREDVWGPDALEFKPERWAQQRFSAWQFLPFSGGPRICIGQQYSIIETSYLLVKLLLEFDRMEPVGWSDALAVRKGMGLTMWPREGVNVRMHRAARTVQITCNWYDIQHVVSCLSSNLVINR